jgi:hypothetical protein
MDLALESIRDTSDDLMVARWSQPGRSFLTIAPRVDSLNVVWMIVPPRSAHAARANVVRCDVAVVGEPFLAQCTDATLRCNLLVQQFSHFRVRTDLPKSSRVVGIVDATDPQLPCSSDL